MMTDCLRQDKGGPTLVASATTVANNVRGDSAFERGAGTYLNGAHTRGRECELLTHIIFIVVWPPASLYGGS